MFNIIMIMLPQLFALLLSDDEKGVTLLPQVLKDISEELDVTFERKEDVLSHLIIKDNEADILRLRAIEQKYQIDISKLNLENIALQQLEDKNISANMLNNDKEIQNKLVTNYHQQVYFTALLGVIAFFGTALFVEDKSLSMAISAFVGGMMANVNSLGTNIYGFFFGSSLGSKNKDEKLKI